MSDHRDMRNRVITFASGYRFQRKNPAEYKAHNPSGNGNYGKRQKQDRENITFIYAESQQSSDRGTLFIQRELDTQEKTMEIRAKRPIHAIMLATPYGALSFFAQLMRPLFISGTKVIRRESIPRSSTSSFLRSSSEAPSASL